MSKILIIGAVSVDTIHVAGQTYHALGGAGLYTALAARRTGAEVTLYAPRPRQRKRQFEPIDIWLDWIGPAVSPEQLPALEIAHHGQGKATLIRASWGATDKLIPEDLPPALYSYGIVHVAALPTARAQHEFLDACRQRNARCLSAGTYARIVNGETETVRTLMDRSELFFMNENEAIGLCGSVADVGAVAGQMRFVTLDKRGALLIEHNKRTSVFGDEVEEMDPTGAGDTLCGAVLAGLNRGEAPVAALQNACALAAQTVQHVGPHWLLKAEKK